MSAIAEAERIGHARARETLGRDVLRSLERAAARKRDAEMLVPHEMQHRRDSGWEFWRACEQVLACGLLLRARQ